MFPAPSKSFARRTAKAGSEARRATPANRIARRPEATVRIDAPALDTSAGDANKASGVSIGLPESFFRAPGGEAIHFNDIDAEDAALVDGELAVAAGTAVPPSVSGHGPTFRPGLVASVALHILVAASLLTWWQDGTRIAGGTPNEIAGIGNASAEQIASGDAVNVTITTVPIVKAHAVGQVQDATEPTPTEPALKAQAEAVTVSEATPVETEASPAAVAETLPTVDVTESAPQAEPAEAEVATFSETPEILAAPTFAKSADAAPAAQRPAEMPTEPATQAAEAVPVEEVTPAEVLPAEDVPELARHAPIPSPRPKDTAKPAAKPETRATKAREKPARRTARTSPPGSRGRDDADARRGVAAGRSDGRTASSNDNSRAASAEGNAAVSNYPGKVFAMLRRALRYPPQARGRRLNGTAQVEFVVSRSGTVGSVRLAASSGSPILDSAALAAVERAAPFPPIPEGAGRSSWTFTAPLAFVR